MSTVATIPTIKKKNTSKIKWIADKAVYAITRIEETPIRVLYLSERGGDHDGVRITAYAGEVAVMKVSLSGSHPMTKANFRECMARKVQDLGGSWMGRSHATENAKADARVAAMTDPAVTPSAKDREALRYAYYGRMPHPSDY